MGKQRKGVMPGQKGKGGAKPGKGMVTVEGVRLGRSSGLAIRMEISRSLDNPRFARIISIPSRRILGVTTMRRTNPTRRFPLPPSIEQTGVSSGDSVARERASVGDPLNNEQWSDHLSDPSSH